MLCKRCREKEIEKSQKKLKKLATEVKRQIDEQDFLKPSPAKIPISWEYNSANEQLTISCVERVIRENGSFIQPLYSKN